MHSFASTTGNFCKNFMQETCVSPIATDAEPKIPEVSYFPSQNLYMILRYYYVIRDAV